MSKEDVSLNSPLLDADQRIQRATEATNIPNLYANGFVNHVTQGDILTVLEHNGKPVATINLSYTVAKTLALSIGTLISQLEALTGRDMLTTHDVSLKLNEPKDAKH